MTPAELSGLVMAVMQGMSVLARDGARRASLLAIGPARLALDGGKLRNELPDHQSRAGPSSALDPELLDQFEGI